MGYFNKLSLEKSSKRKRGNYVFDTSRLTHTGEPGTGSYSGKMKPDKAMLAPKAARRPLWKMIEPFINRDSCYLNTKGVYRFAWLYGQAEVTKAIEAWRSGTLKEQSFQCRAEVRGTNRTYTRSGYTHLGILLHRDDMVNVFAVDLDAKEEGRDFTAYRDRIAGFFGAADPLCFRSRGGSGMHLFFRLANPVRLERFREWVKAWGFVPGFIEVTPRSESGGQAGILLPNKGEEYLGGSVDGSLVESLPPAPPKGTTHDDVEFLVGLVDKGKHDALAKTAARITQRGMPVNEAKALLWNAAVLCHEAEEEPEKTRQTIYDQCKWGSEHLICEKPTEDSVAEAVCAEHGENLRYCEELKQWYIWDKRYWRPVKFRRPRQLVKKFVRQDARLKDFRTKHKLDAITDLLSDADRVLVYPDAVDKGSAWLLNVWDGTINLKSGELRPHRQEDFLSRLIPVKYDRKAFNPKVKYNPKTKAGLWYKTLWEIMGKDEEMVRFLLRCLGYTLTGNVREEVFFFAYGSGLNGKSTVLDAVFNLMKDYSCPLKLGTILKTENDGERYEMAKLNGARMAMSHDLRSGATFNDAQIKMLASTDPITARQIYEENATFEPSHKLWLYGNDKPKINAVDKAMWRRIILIPFEQEFDGRKCDPELKNKLKSRECRREILASLVAGCLDWQAQGLNPPEQVKNATEEYRLEENWFARCLSEIKPIQEREKLKDIHWRVVAWCSKSGETQENFTTRMLSKRLEVTGYQKSKDREGDVCFSPKK